VSPQPRLTLDAVRVLLVDDDARVRVTLARVLTRRGCLVAEADSVAAARVALDGASFEVLVTDLGLGDGSGYDVIAHARKVDPRTPVVILSGTLDDIDLDDDLLWCLSKPASSAQLIDTVVEAGRVRRAAATPPPPLEAVVPLPPSDAHTLCDDARARLTVLSAVAALIRDRRDSDVEQILGVRPGLCEDQIERQVARLRSILDELEAIVECSGGLPPRAVAGNHARG
jgi:CheY-like chemotaxis protein